MAGKPDNYTGRVVKVKERRVRSVPVRWELPEIFIRRNNIMIGDKIAYYLTENGELIIAKT